MGKDGTLGFLVTESLGLDRVDEHCSSLLTVPGRQPSPAQGNKGFLLIQGLVFPVTILHFLYMWNESVLTLVASGGLR